MRFPVLNLQHWSTVQRAGMPREPLQPLGARVPNLNPEAAASIS